MLKYSKDGKVQMNLQSDNNVWLIIEPDTVDEMASENS